MLGYRGEMDDPRNRRDLGLICIGAVGLLIGLLARAAAEDGEVSGIAAGIGIAGFWICAIALVSIGVRLIRGR